MANPTIGFIGLGIMGKPMARNLMKAGYPLVVHNRSRAAVDELSKEGAQTAASSQEVAARSEIVITMLPDSPDVELVYLGEQGVFAGAKPGMLLIDMSSISPVIARKLAADAEKRGMDMLDAPVSGGEAGAIGATLSIMIGGKPSQSREPCRSFRRWEKYRSRRRCRRGASDQSGESDGGRDDHRHSQ